MLAPGPLHVHQGGVAAIDEVLAGEQAPVLQPGVDPGHGCAVGAGLSWHGRYVLYSSADGRQAIVDSAERTVTDLGPLARRLPAKSRAERASVEWASSFGG